MEKQKLNDIGLYADTATFIHGDTYNILHDGGRASLYELSNGGKDFKLVVEVNGAGRMRQIAAAFTHAADLTDASEQ